MGLLIGMINASNRTKCVSLSNQKFEIHPTLINLYPNEYNQEFKYHPFAVKLDMCIGSCDTLNDLPDKLCAPNKIDLNVSVFNIITGINGLKTLTKHIPRKSVNVNLMEESVIQINGGIAINFHVSVKNVTYVKKIIFAILLHAVSKMENI